jgi:hypothetical protein
MPAPWSTARPSRERDAPFRKELDAADSLAFMPRLFVLTTLPHRRPESHRFERVNGWQSLRMVAPRRHATHDLARKLGLSIVSGPRGTAAPSLDRLAARLGLPRARWRPSLLLHEHFFSEITRSAVTVDLRAIAQLNGALGAYPELRIRGDSEGLRLYPSPPHVTRHPSR